MDRSTASQPLPQTINDLGPIRARLADKHLRRWPCECHEHPGYVVLQTVRRFREKYWYVLIPYSDVGSDPFSRKHAFDHAFETLLVMIQENRAFNA